MKKICLFLAAVMLLGQISVFGADDAAVVMTYTAAFSKEQGKNGWYFYEYSKTEKELIWNPARGGWKSADRTFPTYNDGEMDPDNAVAVGFRFVATEKGMVRLRGTVTMPYPDCQKGNGVKLIIAKGSNELWSSALTYGKDVSYDIQTSLRSGDTLDFKIDANGNNGYDWTRWYPTVEYLSAAFEENSTDKYYQSKDGERTELSYNSDADAYVASDGLAMISEYNVMPTDEYSLVKSVEAAEDGRYRVLCDLEANDIRCGGVIVKLYKNGKRFWSQLCPDEGKSVVDVGVMCSKGDKIDIEVGVNEFGGYNNYDWSCSVKKYVGTYENTASTSMGENYHYIEKTALGSLIGAAQGTNGVNVYSIAKDVWNPMNYNSSKSRWESPVKLSGEDTGGYISKTAVNPGVDTDSAIEWTVAKTGTIRLSGNVYAPESNDGVVVDIYKNDKLIWSNRVGGTRLVKWDEPFDVAYVRQEINTVTNVKSGDKIVYIFDQWRNSAKDDVDISDFEIGYVSGNVISDTTEWKIKNSVIIDTQTKRALIGGKTKATDALLLNDTSCISKADAETIFGKAAADASAINENYSGLRRISENLGKNILWTADRLVIIYDDLPTFFGFAEIGEIETALEGGDLFG